MFIAGHYYVRQTSKDLRVMVTSGIIERIPQTSARKDVKTGLPQCVSTVTLVRQKASHGSYSVDLKWQHRTKSTFMIFENKFNFSCWLCNASKNRFYCPISKFMKVLFHKPLPFTLSA